jgi:hypothetical protein
MAAAFVPQIDLLVSGVHRPSDPGDSESSA